MAFENYIEDRYLAMIDRKRKKPFTVFKKKKGKYSDLQCMEGKIKKPKGVLEFPFPDKDLSPNSRAHYQQKAKLRSSQKNDCYYVAYGEAPPIQQTYHLKIVFYPPDNRGRDLDNLLASCKGLLDGLAMAWKVDDKQFRPLTIDFGEPVDNGKVTVEVVK